MDVIRAICNSISHYMESPANRDQIFKISEMEFSPLELMVGGFKIFCIIFAIHKTDPDRPQLKPNSLRLASEYAILEIEKGKVIEAATLNNDLPNFLGRHYCSSGGYFFPLKI